MALSILVIGKPGGCKSTAIGTMLREFAKYGKHPEYVSDRKLLEDAVEADVRDGIRLPDG